MPSRQVTEMQSGGTSNWFLLEDLSDQASSCLRLPQRLSCAQHCLGAALRFLVASDMASPRQRTFVGAHGDALSAGRTAHDPLFLGFALDRARRSHFRFDDEAVAVLE